MENQSLAAKVIYFRKSKGYSQEELSLKTQVTVRTIQRIEKGEVKPHLNTVKLLATALDVDVNDLLSLKNPKEESVIKKWLLLIHATPLLGFFIPFCNVLIPLFLWIHKREDNPVYDRHGVKVINFQITVLILALLSFISLVTIEKWGFFIFILTVPICALIVVANIIYVLKTGKSYYPLAIPFLKYKHGKREITMALLFLSMTMFQCSGPESTMIKRLDNSVITADSVSSMIKELSDKANVQGLGVAIFNHNETVYHEVAGYKNYPEKLILTDSTNIYGASLSKAVFSVLVMKLVEENVIDLDTPLESYLPKKIYEYAPLTRWHDNYEDLRGDTLYHRITARMCLNHTTGFANWRFFEEDRKLRVNTIPGEQYHYSGEGFVYLQVVLEKLTGKGLEELAQEIIFKPLQMAHSSYEWKPIYADDIAFGHQKDGRIYEKDIDNEPRSGSTLETTFSDYVKFITAVLNKSIISATSYAEIFSPHVRIQSKKHFGPDSKVMTDKYDDIQLSCGLGWLHFNTPYGVAVSKGGHGDGFQHYSVLFPESGEGVLIMTNSDNGESIYKELLAYVMADVYTPWEWAGYIPYQDL